MVRKLKWAFCVALVVATATSSIGAISPAQSTAITTANYSEITRDALTNAPDFSNGLVKAYKNGAVGFLNTAGEEAVPFIYDDALSFVDGVAPVYNDGLWSFINTSGATVVAPQYYTLNRTSTGEYIAYSSVGMALLATNGQVIIPASSAYIRQSGSYFMVSGDSSDRYYENGTLVLEVPHTSSTATSSFLSDEILEVYSDGYVVVYKDNSCGIRTISGKYLFATTSFDGIVPLGTDGALFNEYGLALFQEFPSSSSDHAQLTNYGFINSDGDILADGFQYISDFSEGYAWAQVDTTNYCIINSAGKITATINRSMQMPGPFTNGLSVVTDESCTKNGFIRTDGSFFTPVTYSTLGAFNGMAAGASKATTSSSAVLDSGNGLILANGTFKEIDGITSIDTTSYGKYFVFYSYSKCGLLYSDGTITASAAYDEIRPLSTITTSYELREYFDEIPLFLARKSGYWGLIDANGNTLIPFSSSSCYVYGESDGKIPLVMDSNTYFIDADTYSVSDPFSGTASGLASGVFVMGNYGAYSLYRMSYADVSDTFSTAVYDDTVVYSDFLPVTTLASDDMERDATTAITPAISSFPVAYYDNTLYKQALFNFLEESMTVATATTTSSASPTLTSKHLSVADEVFYRGEVAAYKLLSQRNISIPRDLSRVYRYSSTSSASTITFDVTTTSLYDVEAVELMTAFGGVRIQTADVKAFDQGELTIKLKQTDAGVTVTMPDGLSGTLLLPADASQGGTIGIVNSQGDRVGGLAQPFTNMISASIQGTETYSITTQALPFTDTAFLPSEMKTAISTLYSMGVVNGKTDTTYAANGSLTRAQLCAMLLRLLPVSDHATTNTFTDLDASDWFYQTALDANALGLITGYGDQTYRGNVVMTRAQVYAVLSRVLTDYKGYDVDVSQDALYAFADGSGAGTWATTTAICANENLVIAQSDNTLDLGAPLTRGDAAVLLLRLAQIIG